MAVPSVTGLLYNYPTIERLVSIGIASPILSNRMSLAKTSAPYLSRNSMKL